MTTKFAFQSDTKAQFQHSVIKTARLSHSSHESSVQAHFQLSESLALHSSSMNQTTTVRLLSGSNLQSDSSGVRDTCSSPTSPFNCGAGTKRGTYARVGHGTVLLLHNIVLKPPYHSKLLCQMSLSVVNTTGDLWLKKWAWIRILS